MPHIRQMKDSKYLKREDVGAGKLVTIERVYQDNLAMQGRPPEMKWLCKFSGVEKPLVLNTTKINVIAHVTGEEVTENWPGKQIVLYDDPNISMQGNLVGGISIRAPRNRAAAPVPAMDGMVPRQPAQARRAPVPPPEPEPEAAAPEEDDVPF